MLPPVRARECTPPFQRRRASELELIDEITTAARCIAHAREATFGDPVFLTDGVFRVLATIARSTYCLAISDLARALGVRKQVAHAFAHAAAHQELIELAPNPQDRRILQAFLTPLGRNRLAAARATEAIWLATLFNGLGDDDLEKTTHVVRVVRQRLERDSRELARRKANALKSEGKGEPS